MNNIKIVLVTEPTTGPGLYSIECGLADNASHFDHHKKEHRKYPSPCNNHGIFPISEGVIQITHVDADTLLGVKRLLGLPLPALDMGIIEEIDLNGSSVCDQDCQELLYMVGVGKLARELKIPRSEVGKEVDVTSYLMEMCEAPDQKLIDLGVETQASAVEVYNRCKVGESSAAKVGFWSVGAEDDFDPSMPYAKGIETVVVYRKHYRSVSIYGDPNSERTYAGMEFAEVLFAGHPKACGSPRGVEMEEPQAEEVYKALCAKYS